MGVRDHVSLRLLCSRFFPLYISLTDSEEKRKSLAFHPGLDVITPQHRRWKEVVLEFSPIAIPAFFRSQTWWSFDELDGFRLEVLQDCLTPSPDFPPDKMFDGAAKLMELQLQNI